MKYKILFLSLLLSACLKIDYENIQPSVLWEPDFSFAIGKTINQLDNISTFTSPTDESALLIPDQTSNDTLNSDFEQIYDIRDSIAYAVIRIEIINSAPCDIEISAEFLNQINQPLNTLTKTPLIVKKAEVNSDGTINRVNRDLFDIEITTEDLALLNKARKIAFTNKLTNFSQSQAIQASLSNYKIEATLALRIQLKMKIDSNS